jgi:twitching motility protein PilT
VRLQLSDVLRAIVSQHLILSTTPPVRVPAYEKLRVTAGVASQIRDDKLHQIQTSIQTGRDDGMVPLERSLAELLRAGRIDRDTARAAAHDERMLADLTRG